MNKKSTKIYIDKIKLLSKIVLKSDFTAFWKRIEVLKESEKFYFEERDEASVDYYLNPYWVPYYGGEGLQKGDVYYFAFEHYLLHQAEDEEGLNRLLTLHWGGEHEEGDFARFVQSSLGFYGVRNFDINFWKQESIRIVDEVELEKGDYLLYQFKAFDRELRAIGFYLLFAYSCYDTHYPIVVNQEEYDKLNGLRIGSLKILNSDRLLSTLMV